MGAQEESSHIMEVQTEAPNRSPSSESSDASPNDSDTSRGRKQERQGSVTPKADPDGEHEEDGDGDGDTVPNGKPRKRKRSRKGLEKNFPCGHPGCGKSYSRAEHLYRHQLNRRCPTLPAVWRFSSLTMVDRYSQKDICLRFPRLCPRLRPARSLRKAPGTTHRPWFESAKERSLHP